MFAQTSNNNFNILVSQNKAYRRWGTAIDIADDNREATKTDEQENNTVEKDILRPSSEGYPTSLASK